MRAILGLLATGILLAVTSVTSAEPPENPDPGTGALLAKMNGALVPMPVVAMDVSLSISGPIVRGRVVQTFTNPTAETLEAEYVFPLPEGAAVDGLMLEVGDRRFVGEIHEKEAARRTYEKARAEGKGAGLVEQQRPNIFRTRVANIPPHASIVVHLDTLDEAEWSEGWFSTTFPTTITARYAPLVALRATLDAGLKLAAITSSSHRVRTTEHGSSSDVKVGDGPVPADRDFVLRWQPKAELAVVAGGLVEERADGRYGLAMLVPPRLSPSGAGTFPTQTVFVVDVSGSMSGPSLDQAKAALDVALGRLRPARSTRRSAGCPGFRPEAVRRSSRRCCVHSIFPSEAIPRS